MDPLIVFSGNPLDRAAQFRTDSAKMAALAQRSDALVLRLYDLKPPIRLKPRAGIAWAKFADIRPEPKSDTPLVFLGLKGETPYFALPMPAGAAQAEDGVKIIDVRSIAPSVELEEAAMLAQARSMIDWHARHRFCANCGAPTKAEAAGWNRKCDACQAQHFPRTDPVVIMLAVRGDRCLLGRQSRFIPNTFSALAGFVEQGETIEEAVARELYEEAGIRTGCVAYFASQPWPFPSSLMIGCFAEAVSEGIAVDRDELEDARWFHKDDLREMLRRAVEGGDGLRLPPPLAIAHQLAKAWIEGRAEALGIR
jgi:NAD+ diphosphatase